MTRRPPSILGVFPMADGGFEVRWGVDLFFPDSDEPERVLVELNGLQFAILDGAEDSIEVPLARITALGTSTITVSISFLWSASPAEELQSSVQVPVQTGPIHGNAGVLPAMKPIVTLVDVRPEAANTPSSITIRWRTNNHNDGNIVWGPSNAPRSFVRNIRPANASVTTGTFTTDRPLTANTLYVFTVEVRNTLHSTKWLSTSAVFRSAADRPTFVPTDSLRQFLQRSGRPLTSSVAPLVGPSRSVRKMLLG